MILENKSTDLSGADTYFTIRTLILLLADSVLTIRTIILLLANFPFSYFLLRLIYSSII